MMIESEGAGEIAHRKNKNASIMVKLSLQQAVEAHRVVRHRGSHIF
jgi:hypothetical protein